MPHFGISPLSIAFYLFWVILFFLLFKLSLTANYSKKLWTYAKQISDRPSEQAVLRLIEHLEKKKQSYKNERSRIVSDACRNAFASSEVSEASRVKMRQLLLDKGFVLEEVQEPVAVPVTPDEVVEDAKPGL